MFGKDAASRLSLPIESLPEGPGSEPSVAYSARTGTPNQVSTTPNQADALLLFSCHDALGHTTARRAQT